MFIPVSTLYYGLDLLRLGFRVRVRLIGMSSEKRQPADFRESKKKKMHRSGTQKPD